MYFPLVFFTIILSPVHSVNVALNVAPGDGNELCSNSPGRQAVANNRKVLLDTQDYREQSLVGVDGSNGIWISENFDGINTLSAIEKWADLAQTSTCIHNFLACDTENQPQNNWLITQYINITNDDVKEVHVFMSFSTTSGSNCPTCKQFFTVQSYDTNVIDETGRTNRSLYTDIGVKFFHTLSGTEIQELAIEPVPVSANGVYLAVVDTGSCTLITRLYVFYYVCPHQVVDMVEYPEVMSPPSNQPDVPAIGKCINNSSPVGGASLDLECDSNGLWDNSDLSCSCDPGYEPITDICEPCTEGEYKDVQSNTECTSCPDNSNTTTTGSTRCDCNNGYYRTDTENITVKCTTSPSAPVGVSTDGINSMSINIKWSPPTDNGGRSDVSYRVTYSNGSFTSPVFSVDGSSLSYNITGLTPSREYTISVESANGVSYQDIDNVASRTVTINATTDDRGPSKPKDLKLSEDDVLQWSQPDYLYGNLLYYNLWIASTNNFSQANIQTTTNNTSYDLNMLDIERGTYYLWVQAITNNGDSEVSDSVRHVRVSDTITDSSGKIQPGSIAGIAVAGSVVIIIGLICCVSIPYLLQRKFKKQKSTESSLHVSSFEMEDQKDLKIKTNAQQHNEKLLNKLNLLSCVIDPSDLKLMEKVGQGEFGIVYRGVLRNDSSMMSVAIKTVRGLYSDSLLVDEIFVEAEKMKSFDHLHVLSLTGVCVGLLESPCIVMPFMSNGSLLSYLRRDSADLTINEMVDDNLFNSVLKHLLSICLQVAKGMDYLSQQKFVHRDLAARNCMLSSEGIIKIADFGLAEDIYTTEYFKQVQSSDSTESVKLPLKWMALESIHFGKFDEKTDVWSYGVLCWEVFNGGKMPYPGSTPREVVTMLDNGERLTKPTNAACTKEVFSIMLSCWKKSPKCRPRFFELVENINKLLIPLADYLEMAPDFKINA